MKNQMIPKSWRESIDELREDIGRTVDRWLSRLKPDQRREAETSIGFDLWDQPWSLAGINPRVDVTEDDANVLVTVEIPGLRKEDLSVDLDNRTLTISGHKESRSYEKQGRTHVSECRYGSFIRVIPLPCEVIREKVKAKYRLGVLRLTLPKTESAKARTIDVTYED